MAAATETTRIFPKTKKLVAALSRDLDVPQTEVLARAVEEFSRAMFLKNFEESVAAASEQEIAEDKAEAAAWDATLADGLEND